MESYSGAYARETIMDMVQNRFPQLAEPALIQEIAEHGQLMKFSAGEIIQDTGSYIRLVPLLIEGSIKVSREEEDGREIFLYYLNGGQTCSMSFSCCMMQKKSNLRTLAEEDTTLVGIPIRYVDDWMNKYVSWKNFVMRSYDDRLNEMINTIDSIAFRRMDERLLDYLEKKSEANGGDVIRATHQEIAYDLNASREAVSRLLKQMERDGMVKLGRNQIQLI